MYVYCMCTGKDDFVISWFFYSGISVSYTHLDVYKRQTQYNTIVIIICALITSVQNEETITQCKTICVTLKCFVENHKPYIEMINKFHTIKKKKKYF